jgi:hypothetical protein
MTALQMIERAADGRIFSIEFRKRTDGTVRRMTCRRGVTKGVTGSGMSYDPTSKGLLCVYDLQEKDFRHISLDRLIGLRMGGETFEWDGRRWVQV